MDAASCDGVSVTNVVGSQRICGALLSKGAMVEGMNETSAHVNFCCGKMEQEVGWG